MPKLTQTISKAQGKAILHPVWEDVCEKFADQGHTEPESARVRYEEDAHDSDRHFARAAMDGSFVEFAPSLALAPMQVILGIMSHEAGHLVDLTHPGRFWMEKGKLVEYDEIPSKNGKKFLDRWHRRSDDDVEIIADRIAEVVMGFTIGYVGPCLVQCADCGGVRRPKGLR
jgi:hypothetical protein